MATLSLNKKLSVLFVLFHVCCMGQNPVEAAAKISKPKKDLVYSNYVCGIDFILRDNKLVSAYSLEKEISYLTEAGLAYNSLSVNYSDFYSSNIELEAFSLTPKKSGKYKKTKVKQFFKRNVASSGIFYEDLIKQSCVFPNLKTDSKAVLKYRSIITDPVLTPYFLFNYEIAANQLVLKINVPDFVKVKLAFIGDSTDIIHKAVKTPTSTVHTYSCANRKAIDFEDNSTNLTYYTPHIVAVPVSYKINGTEINLAGNVGNLFSRYNKNIKEILESDNSELYKMTDSLIKNIPDTLEKIKVIYNWVQKNIKYVAFEEGKGGFVPRPAAKIVTNKFGDCKDKANLLITMLNRAKINCYHTWIGSRSKPYTYEQLPSPYSDDHMIAALRYKGKWSFLDATAPFIEFGFPSSFIQGKEALIRLSDTTFTVQKVPVVQAQGSVRIDSISVNISNDVLTGNGNRSVSGYIKERYQHLISTSKQEADVIKDRLDIGNNKLVINNFNLAKAANFDIKPTYEFTLPNYLQVFDSEIYLNLNLIKDYDNQYIKVGDRKLDIEEDYKFTISQNIQLNIPANKTIKQVPQNQSFENADFSFDINYKLENKKLTMNKTIVMNHLILNRDNFDKWNNMIEKLSKAYSEVVIIKNK